MQVLFFVQILPSYKMLMNLLIFRYSGFSTLGDIDNVRFVGPIAPATYFWLPVILVTSVAARLASMADSKFNLKDKKSRQ